MANQDNQPNIPPPHSTEPVVDKNGRLTPAWKNWFMQLWRRVGREIALDNVQLENIQQESLDEVKADISTLQGQMTAVQNVNVAQTNEINALKSRVEALELEPVA